MSAVPSVMQAIEFAGAGGLEVIRLAERPVPSPKVGEVLIRVAAAGLNRGDTAQRMGFYPPPPGVTDIPGLEAAGTIVALGRGVSDWKLGDRVCALLAGGGYAEYAVVPAGQCLALPRGLTMIEGAALPEALFTCWTNLVDGGRLKAGETLLVHGGASGMGTMAIQMGRELGARVIATAGSAEKCDACLRLGADLAINYHVQDFVAAIADRFGPESVDVVLDMVGADYLPRSIQCLGFAGRYVVIGMMKRGESTISVGDLVRKKLVLTGSTLRARSPAQKRRIRNALMHRLGEKLAAREIVAEVYRTFPLEQAAESHRLLEAGDHIGKLILTTRHCED